MIGLVCKCPLRMWHTCHWWINKGKTFYCQGRNKENQDKLVDTPGSRPVVSK